MYHYPLKHWAESRVRVKPRSGSVPGAILPIPAWRWPVLPLTVMALRLCCLRTLQLLSSGGVGVRPTLAPASHWYSAASSTTHHPPGRQGSAGARGRRCQLIREGERVLLWRHTLHGSKCDVIRWMPRDFYIIQVWRIVCCLILFYSKVARLSSHQGRSALLWIYLFTAEYVLKTVVLVHFL